MIPKESPCYGCQIVLPQGEKRRAPCCWDMTLKVSVRHYVTYFRGNPQVRFITYTNDRWMGEEALIQISEACPNLNPQTGECLIQHDKPFSCTDVQPFTDPVCVRNPQNSYHEYYIPLSQVE